ncbi:MAG: hypothetical protein WCT52_03840 [Candidatus Micrarchaeia archaeon]
MENHGIATGAFRGQAAVEALSYGAFFMLIFVGAVAVFLQMQSQDLTRAEYAYAQQVAYGFADSIYVTSLAGTGFVQTVSVPSDLLGRGYNITISRPQQGAKNQAELETGFVYVEWIASNGKLGSVSAPTITTRYDMVTYGSQITNNTRGFVVIGSGIGRLNLSNVNGTIIVSRA